MSSPKTGQRKPNDMCLKEMCFRAVRRHFSALGVEAVLDLPAPLIEDLLPHLTVCQLDELQPALNQRGISTRSGWVGFLREMCGPNHVVDLHTEEEAKHEVMRTLFTLVFYGFTNPFVKRNITNLNTPSFLRAAAKCIRHFLLTMSLQNPLRGLTAEQRPLLNLLEKQIRCISVSQSIDLLKRKTQAALYVLHRLLDHGAAKELIVHVQCPIMLAWLLHGRGSQYVNPELENRIMHGKKATSAGEGGASCSPGFATRTSEDQEDEVIPYKRSKLDSAALEEEESGRVYFTVDPQDLCQTFAPCRSPSGAACPWGQIHSLEIKQCGSNSLRVLNAALPTFFCLRSLTLHSFSTFRESDVVDLAAALKRLSQSSRSSLSDLSISVLPYTRLVETLLDAEPNLTSLHVEIQTVEWGPRLSPHHPRTAQTDTSELPLQKLTVKVAELLSDLDFVASVLRRSPHLTSLHVSGMRLPVGSSQSQLLSTLSESNRCLRSLHLEDMKLSDCLPAILNLLRDCRLEELRFNDCRLLEKLNNKEETLQQLVSGLKKVTSLHTLGLAQNRLAKNVCVLAELFSGSSPSAVKRLDISSNFIQPAELLEFSKRLRTHRPPHCLILDLRKNPGDRDPETWNTALKTLRPFCVPLIEGWVSTNSMADHISNM